MESPRPAHEKYRESRKNVTPPGKTFTPVT